MKQQGKHERTGEEQSQAGKSPTQLFVCVLNFLVQNDHRLSQPSRLFGSTKHILIPLKVHTPK
jgi:hypothetical protein